MEESERQRETLGERAKGWRERKEREDTTCQWQKSKDGEGEDEKRSSRKYLTP